MKRKKNILTIILSLLFVFSIGNIAFAEGGEPIEPSNTLTNVKLNNPLCVGDKGNCVKTIPDFVKVMLDIILKIGVPIVALAIIYTGYLFIAAQGKPEKLAEAKKAIVYVFLGAFILLGAYVIAQALQGTLNAIRGV